jgi:hypothetical protein
MLLQGLIDLCAVYRSKQAKICYCVDIRSPSTYAHARPVPFTLYTQRADDDWRVEITPFSRDRF